MDLGIWLNVSYYKLLFTVLEMTSLVRLVPIKRTGWFDKECRKFREISFQNLKKYRKAENTQNRLASIVSCQIET